MGYKGCSGCREGGRTLVYERLRCVRVVRVAGPEASASTPASPVSVSASTSASRRGSRRSACARRGEEGARRLEGSALHASKHGGNEAVPWCGWRGVGRCAVRGAPCVEEAVEDRLVRGGGGGGGRTQSRGRGPTPRPPKCAPCCIGRHRSSATHAPVCPRCARRAPPLRPRSQPCSPAACPPTLHPASPTSHESRLSEVRHEARGARWRSPELVTPAQAQDATHTPRGRYAVATAISQLSHATQSSNSRRRRQLAQAAQLPQRQPAQGRHGPCHAV